MSLKCAASDLRPPGGPHSAIAACRFTICGVHTTRERERETNRERERDKERERERERQRDKETERERERERSNKNTAWGDSFIL